MIGTALLTALVSNYYATLALTSKADNSGLLLGIFMITMFSARVSGSHYNPSITFSYMVGNVKHGNFDRILGILYLAA